MSTEENKALPRRLLEEVWSTGNIALVDELLGPNFTFNYAFPGVPSDREGYKQTVSMFHTAFHDMRITPEDMLAEGGKVAVRWRGRFIHQGEFMGVAATRKEVTTTGICMFKMEGGKIVEEWMEMDAMGLLQQIGAVPPPGQG